LISFFLLVAEQAMLCGEKPAVISTVLLLLAAANPDYLGEYLSTYGELSIAR
jgi:hypothetical protein